MQIHWFAKGIVNYVKVKKNIRMLLKEAGFSITEITYLYEKDTGVTHLIFSCNIEEDDTDG